MLMQAARSHAQGIQTSAKSEQGAADEAFMLLGNFMKKVRNHYCVQFISIVNCSLHTDTICLYVPQVFASSLLRHAATAYQLHCTPAAICSHLSFRFVHYMSALKDWQPVWQG